MKRIRPILIVPLGILMLLNGCVTERLTSRTHGMVLRHISRERPCGAAEARNDTVPKVRDVGLSDSALTAVSIGRDERGDEILSAEIEAVTVVSAAKSISERGGAVEVAFDIVLPRAMQANGRSVTITPVLHRDGRRLPLQDITVRGTVFDRLQARDYWQYARYMKFRGAEKRSVDDAFGRFVRFPYRTDLRNDTVVRAVSDVAYRYKQRIPLATAGNTLKITLEGHMTALDGNTYPLVAPDTLTYHIASMTSFVDTTARYVDRIIGKYIRVGERYSLDFAAGDTRIVDTCGNNDIQLTVMFLMTEQLLKSREFAVDSIVIRAAASPEGSASLNFSLSGRRAETVRERIAAWFPESGLDTITNAYAVGEDWENLIRMLIADGGIEHGEAIADIIRTEQDDDRREMLIRSRYPADYDYMRERLYPRLRRVEMIFHLHRKDMVQDTIHTTVLDTVYTEGRKLLEQRRYHEALALLSPYADRNTAICLLSIGGRDDEALDILLSLDGDNPVVCYLRAIAFVRTGRREEALRAFDAACRLDENLVYRAALDPELNELLNEW